MEKALWVPDPRSQAGPALVRPRAGQIPELARLEECQSAGLGGRGSGPPCCPGPGPRLPPCATSEVGPSSSPTAHVCLSLCTGRTHRSGN